jgi:membrane fusion protein, multidrug efflux system
MNSFYPVFSGLVVGALALAASGAAAAPPANPAPVVEVKVKRPQRGEIVRYITLPGTVRANQQATLYAKVAGYLKSIAVDKGDSVNAGQDLAEIEVPELLADRRRFQAEVEVAKLDYQRLSAARQKGGDLIMPQTVDEAKGRLEIAQANLQRTETLLAYSRVTAPFNGIVTMRYVDPGAFIPAATSGRTAPTAAILTLMDFDIVRVQVPVPELEAPNVRVGEPVRVVVESLPGRAFDGKVSRFTYALDDATKTMLVEADLPNPRHELRPGMYATVRVGVEQHRDAWLLPSAAIILERDNAFVFVAQSGRARKAAVKIGFNDGTQAEVTSGLTGNEAVVLPGSTALADGQPIQTVEDK